MVVVVKIIVFVVSVLLSVAFCFVTFLFLKRQNFYVDLQCQYKDKDKEDSYNVRRKRGDECGPPSQSCPTPPQQKRSCSPPPAECKTKSPSPMKIPSYCMESDSDSCIVDSNTLARIHNRKQQKCAKPVCSKPVCETTNEKSQHRRSKERPPTTKSKPKTADGKPCCDIKIIKVRSKSKHCKQSSGECTCSDRSDKRCKPRPWSSRNLSKDRKKRVDCVVMVDSQMPFSNHPVQKTSTLLPLSYLPCSAQGITHEDGVSLKDSSSSYKKMKASTRVEESKSGDKADGKKSRHHRDVNNGDRTDLRVQLPTCSNHNLEKLREKRKERKKTLLKLQYESGKLDDIHKWISGASNSSDRS